MKPIYKKSILSVFVLVCVVAVMFTLHSVFNQNMPPKASWKHSFNPERRRPATLEDLSKIAPWMTFDYLNKVYDLPSGYLQDALKVTDTKYPFLTIKQHATKTGVTTAALIESLQAILTIQLTTKASQ